MGVTIKDIAARAQVSYSTVSRALAGHPDINHQTRERIKKYASELGYTPNALAKGLVTKSTKTLGLVLPDIANPFFTSVAQGIEDAAHRHGYQVFLCNTNWEQEREAAYLKRLYGNRVDGIVIAPASDVIEHIMDMNSKVPVVFAAYKPKDYVCSYVVTDNFKSAFIAVEYLIKLGHRRIAYIGGKKDDSTNIERFNGYVHALNEHGLEVCSDYVLNGHYTESSGYALTQKLLLSSNLPTAVLAGNDMIALGVLQAIDEFGLMVPKDISVIGIDDIAYAALQRIELTTIHQSKSQIGEMCVEILISMIQVPKCRQAVYRVLEPSLVLRKTCKGL